MSGPKIYLFVIAAAALAGCDVAEPERAPLYHQMVGKQVIYDLSVTRDDNVAPAMQVWLADGTTVYDTKTHFLGRQHGLWEIRDGQYCSSFGHVPDNQIRDWACWDVTIEADRIVFSNDDPLWVSPRRVEGTFLE